MTTLTPYEGREVVSSGFTAPSAGGGFHKALKVSNLEKHHGEEFTLAVRVKVRDIQYKPVSDDAPVLERVHVLQVLNAAEIDEATVAEALDAQQKLIEAANGVTRLDFTEGEGEDTDPADATD
jgi:hypothetical protein